jgi:hypothetical protein
MTAPIFSAAPSGSLAQQYMHRARMFRQAAIDLPGYSAADQNWPKYALLMHAVELVLKAFALHSGHDMSGARPPKHDLSGWYHLALGYGLPVNSGVGRQIDVLDELHRSLYPRYPKQSARPVPGLENIADDAVDWLLDTCTRVINPR